jgi:hypothetical protein
MLGGATATKKSNNCRIFSIVGLIASTYAAVIKRGDQVARLRSEADQARTRRQT